MDYLIPICLALLGLIAMFTPNWLLPVFIVVAGWLGLLAWGEPWLMIFYLYLTASGWLMHYG